MNHGAGTLASSSLHRFFSDAKAKVITPRPFNRPVHRRSDESSSIAFSRDASKRFMAYLMSTSLELPLLPFESEEEFINSSLRGRAQSQPSYTEVLIPSESKILHLYEARYLELLEESLLKRKGFFVHFILQQVLADRSSSGSSFAARYGCLVHIENIDRLDIGALVSIRGIGRVSIVALLQLEPYLRGIVIPIQDNACVAENEMESKVAGLRALLRDLHSLQIKLKAPRHELLQTRAKSALVWAEREIYGDCDEAFIPKLAERVSFAALQPVSGCSRSELFALQKEKLRAMDYRDTFDRLTMGIKFAKQNSAMTAAKLAIQSLEL